MHKKLLELLTAKCKDMGLSEAALQQIAGIASNGLDDNATEEVIAERVKQYEPIMKAMQSEATRWAQSKRQPPTPPTPPQPKPNEDEPWKKAMEELETKYAGTLKTQSDTIAQLQAKLATSERKDLISSEMKKLGLTEADMEFVSIPDDAKVDEYLGKYKQSLVDRGLKPADNSTLQEAKKKAETDMADSMLKQFSVDSNN